MNIHILVLVIAIALFGVLAFKQMSALILAPLVTIFVILCSVIWFIIVFLSWVFHEFVFNI